MKRSVGARWWWLSPTMRVMRASIVSDAARVVRSSTMPWPFTVPANTSSPAVFQAGTDSPVTSDWST